MKKLKVSLDGGMTYNNADVNDVRVIYEDVDSDLVGDGTGVDVHITLSPEGIVTDIYSSETNVGTNSILIEEEVERLVSSAGWVDNVKDI